MRANTHTFSTSMSYHPVSHPLLHFSPFLFSVCFTPSLSLFLFQPVLPGIRSQPFADVHVFRARLRFRLFDAEGRLIVAPFLSVVFTAWGNSPRRESRENGRAAVADREKEGQSIFR